MLGAEGRSVMALHHWKRPSGCSPAVPSGTRCRVCSHSVTQATKEKSSEVIPPSLLSLQVGEPRPERSWHSARKQQSHMEKLGLQIPRPLFHDAVASEKHAQRTVLHREEVRVVILKGTNPADRVTRF